MERVVKIVLQVIINYYMFTMVVADQSLNLRELVANYTRPRPYPEWAAAFEAHDIHQVIQANKDMLGSMEADRIASLPGQPAGVDITQYSGYVSVNKSADKSLFYYFVESPTNAASKPLVLWLNGGPGCTSVGNGAFQEIGPFRVKNDSKTLYNNPYSWIYEANVLFLDSPAGVGFSVGDPSVFTQSGDASTARDTLVFLVNWLDRFPQYKKRDLYLAGESYAGHYVPQLASLILSHDKLTNSAGITIKGILMGNAWLDDETNQRGQYDYLWDHALISDETHDKIRKFCNFSDFVPSFECNKTTVGDVWEETGKIHVFDIYASTCADPAKNHSTNRVETFDPCAVRYVHDYLNAGEVQKALHAKPSFWSICRFFQWKDRPNTILPIIRNLIEKNLSVWIYSGDVDGCVPVTSSRYTINKMKLPVEERWRPWYSDDEIGGYVVGYQGLVFVTIRGAGHEAPSYQPKRARSMFSSFLGGTLPPRLPAPN